MACSPKYKDAAAVYKKSANRRPGLVDGKCRGKMIVDWLAETKDESLSDTATLFGDLEIADGGGGGGVGAGGTGGAGAGGGPRPGLHHSR